MLQGRPTPVAGMSRSGIAGRAASTSPRRNVNDSLRLLVLQKTSIFAELIGFMDIDGVWCVFHAMVPPTKKFKRELGWR